jgi:hypothetical protein
MILETYARIFVNAYALQNTVNFYKTLLLGNQILHLLYPDTGLELAAVSLPHLSVLIIAGTPDYQVRSHRAVCGYPE